MPIPYLACMLLVARLQHLPPRLMPSIQAMEGGAVGTVREDRDGSDDLGVMQINTRWLPTLSKRFGIDTDGVRAVLVSYPCLNILVASAILRMYLREAGGNMQQAIGDCHSHAPMLNHSYQLAVIGEGDALFGPHASHH